MAAHQMRAVILSQHSSSVKTWASLLLALPGAVANVAWDKTQFKQWGMSTILSGDSFTLVFQFLALLLTAFIGPAKQGCRRAGLLLRRANQLVRGVDSCEEPAGE